MRKLSPTMIQALQAINENGNRSYRGNARRTLQALQSRGLVQVQDGISSLTDAGLLALGLIPNLDALADEAAEPQNKGSKPYTVKRATVNLTPLLGVQATSWGQPQYYRPVVVKVDRNDVVVGYVAELNYGIWTARMADGTHVWVDGRESTMGNMAAQVYAQYVEGKIAGTVLDDGSSVGVQAQGVTDADTVTRADQGSDQHTTSSDGGQGIDSAPIPSASYSFSFSTRMRGRLMDAGVPAIFANTWAEMPEKWPCIVGYWRDHGRADQDDAHEGIDADEGYGPAVPHATVSVVVDGALDAEETFTDDATMRAFVADIEREQADHGYRTAVYVLNHDHPVGIDCDCAQYVQDHAPAYVFDAAAREAAGRARGEDVWAVALDDGSYVNVAAGNAKIVHAED